MLDNTFHKDLITELRLKDFGGLRWVAINDDLLPIARINVLPEFRLLTPEIINDLRENPLLFFNRITVFTSDSTYESKSPLTTLLTHGFRDDMGVHVSHPRSRPYSLSTESLYNGVNMWLANNGLPKIDMFISCDEPIKSSGRPYSIKTRWDQVTSNDVIGAAGLPNFVEIYNDTIALNLKSPWKNPKETYVDPFTNMKSFKRHLVEQKFIQKPI